MEGNGGKPGTFNRYKRYQKYKRYKRHFVQLKIDTFLPP